ncbi:helix-turn-helix transcriptional regulator [Psychrobium sp. 1_MG-2023]|uniref:helix-turn-helix domain-containing protein n=1 Tax=Psychrobium sp. 1_MG-2023 TaxID=3062624 RepID=UPI000C33F4B0|nr:helix-turn-helix transcriptional regulator [Psychrobium sp. 1_MG-2023]MDP2561395.1 helix-turn-helix transcriptional regulator [Psychrobium sp. 1_MG-2023]PKF54873.1 transcriptional regulator [Alteromonadales bacterium alter-6D02]
MNYTINTLDQLKPILIGFRKSHGLSQKALAEKLGISQQSYQALESAPQKVTLERLYKVLNVLSVKLQFVDNKEIGNENTNDNLRDKPHPQNDLQDEW